MMGRTSSFLGLAVGDRAVACAEVQVTGDRRTVRRTATFVFPSDMSLDKPEAAGQALAAFLRAKKFSASRAVVGLPARWLIAIEREVPPAGEDQARATLRLQAERLAVSESGELLFDFAGETSSSTASKVLLVGVPKSRLSKVEQLIDAAGMSIAAITSTGLALSAAIDKAEKDATMLVLSRGGAELIWRQAGAPRLLRHLAYVVNGDNSHSIATLGAELRRSVTFSATNGSTGRREMLLLDGVGMPQEKVGELSQRLGFDVRNDDGTRMLGLSPIDRSTDASDEPESPGYFAPALSLALAGAKPSTIPVDFAHSRLTPPAEKRFGRKAVWGGIVGGLIVLAIAALYFDVHHKESDVADLNDQLKQIKPTADAAQLVLDRVKYSRGFFNSRPPVLEALREITLAFGDDTHIWVTSFKIPDNGHGQIIGKATDQRSVINLVEKLNKNPRFSDVRNLGMVESDNKTHDVTYTIVFTYRMEQ
jgi:hypothetical protein